jgi:hypothetical protein
MSQRFQYADHMAFIVGEHIGSPVRRNAGNDFPRYTSMQ